MSHYAALPKAVALVVPLTLGAWTVHGADLIQTAEQDGRFTGFLHLLEAAGMVEVLEGEGPFTVFAPVDEAFGQLPPGVLEWLLAEENADVLQTIIQSHIVPGSALLAQDFLDHEVELETLGGAILAVGGTAGVILVLPLEAAITEIKGRAESKSEGIPASAIVVEAQQGTAGAQPSTVPAGQELTAISQELTAVAMVVEPDIEANNGVIHGIDAGGAPEGAGRAEPGEKPVLPRNGVGASSAVQVLLGPSSREGDRAGPRGPLQSPKPASGPARWVAVGDRGGCDASRAEAARICYGGGGVRRALQERGEPLAAVDVASLRMGPELAGVHVLDHALAQRADRTLVIETASLVEVDTSIFRKAFAGPLRRSHRRPIVLDPGRAPHQSIAERFSALCRTGPGTATEFHSRPAPICLWPDRAGYR